MQLGKRRRAPQLYGPGPQGADARADGPTVRVVHICPPIMVYADPSDFRQVVQQLTGKVSISVTAPTANERSKSLDSCEASSASSTLESGSCKEVNMSQSEHSIMCDSGQIICNAVSLGQSMCYSGHQLPLLSDADQQCYADEVCSYIIIDDEISSDSEAALAAFSSREAETSSPSQIVSTAISGDCSPTNYSKNYITINAHGCINPDKHGRLKQLKTNISSPIISEEEEEFGTPINLNLGTPLSAPAETDQQGQRVISSNWSDDVSPVLTASPPHQSFHYFDAFPFVDCLELECFDSQLDYLLL